MTKILGISEGSHDAAWCLINNNYIIEAHHAERHSRKKNDKWINKHLLPQGWFNVVGHEDKVRVNERRLFAGQKYQDENGLKNIYITIKFNHSIFPLTFVFQTQTQTSILPLFHQQ